MTDPTLDALRALVAKWQKRADGLKHGPFRDLRSVVHGHIYAECATDLEAVLSAALASASGEQDKMQWTLDNIYTIARRETARQVADERSNKMWRHVIRLCEAVGCQPRGVLRDNGGSLTGTAEPAGDAASADGAESTTSLTTTAPPRATETPGLYATAIPAEHMDADVVILPHAPETPQT